MKRKTIIVCLLVAAAVMLASKFVSGLSKLGSRDLKRFLGTEISFDGFDYPESRCRMVIYYDSAACSTCKLSYVREWDFLFQECHEFNGFLPIFVFSPRKPDWKRYQKMLSRQSTENYIISDYKSAFSSANPGIPKAQSLHVFLLDRDNKVVLAGDPLHNGRLWGLYKLYIEAICNNDGAVPENIEERIAGYMSETSGGVNGLVFNERYRYTGTIEKDLKYHLSFTACNVCSHTVIISHIMTDCDCTEASASTTEIAPGQTVTISVDFTQDQEGEFRKSVFIRTAGDPQDIELTFEGLCE